jgi:hypothetical protein
MSRTEDIDNEIWDDEDYADLSPHSKLLYLWSWTNTRCGMAGLYKVTRSSMLATKIPEDQLDAVLAELADARFLYYEKGVIWVRSRAKRLRSKSPQMAKSVAKDVAKLADDHPMRIAFMNEYRDAAWLRGHLPTTYREPIGNLSEKPMDTEDSDRLSGTSREVPRTRTRTGTRERDEGRGRGRRAENRRVDQTQPPADFPADRLPVLRSCLAELHDAWEQRGGRIEPQCRGVGLAMLRNLECDHLTIAKKLRHWLLAGNGQSVSSDDVAGRFGDWVAKEPRGKPSLAVVGANTPPDFSEYDRAAGLTA